MTGRNYQGLRSVGRMKTRGVNSERIVGTFRPLRQKESKKNWSKNGLERFYK